MTTAWTPTTWAEEVLTDANLEAPSAPAIPIDPNTVSDIEHWMPAEEPIGDWYDRNNPLNASLGTDSSDGTGPYSSLSTGAEETAAMIDQGNMAGIRNALASDDQPTAFSTAVVESPWAGGHYGVAAAGATGSEIVPGRGLNYIATTAPGGGPAPASAGYVGQAPAAVSASALDTLNESATPTATEAGLNANPFDLFGIPQTIGGDAASSIWSLVGPFIVKGILVVTGLGVVVLGLSKMTGEGKRDIELPELGKLAKAAPEAVEAAA